MIRLKDKGDVYSWLCLDQGNTVCYEDGTREPLTVECCEVVFWKYDHESLSEIDDEGALRFMLKVAGEKQDRFAEAMFKRRLAQL